jgi:hypothetical protein
MVRVTGPLDRTRACAQDRPSIKPLHPARARGKSPVARKESQGAPSNGTPPRPTLVGKRTLFATALLSCCAASLAIAPACVDLFHSTNFETLCDLDAKAPGCPSVAPASPSDGGDATRADAAPTNFCGWSSDEARQRAEQACAWLGACSSPFDENAFGRCMIHAILAYDCTANPNRTIALGPLHDYWDALSRAKSCADVDAVLPHPSIRCTESLGYACVDASPDLLFQCTGGVAQAESCLVSGWTCQGLACATPQEKSDCDPPGCSGTVLHACQDGGSDEGYDCRYFGKGTCEASEGHAGCVPVTAKAAGRCTPTMKVTCDGEVALGCPTGLSEAVDCEFLTGKGTCNAGATPSWSLAQACQGATSCEAGCGGDANDTLSGCGNGADFTTSCKAQGLGPCRSLRLAQGTGYACTPPQ